MIGQQEKVGPITEQYHEIFVSVFVFVVKLKLATAAFPTRSVVVAYATELKLIVNC